MALSRALWCYVLRDLLGTAANEILRTHLRRPVH
jgi:hypothetical protein